MLDAWLDLVLGSRCSACDRPGRALCRACEAGLPRAAFVAWPVPPPAGLVRPVSAAEYADPVRRLILDHKEHARLALAGPLGRLLAAAVADVVATAPVRPVEVDLVPVPSHPAVVRQRGHDPLLRLSRCAAARLRRGGVPARLRPVLRVLTRPGDQSALGAAERAANLRGRFAAVAVPAPGAAVVLVDDVLTTGATLREAQRALEAAGVAPLGAAVVAATRLRSSGTWASGG